MWTFLARRLLAVIPLLLVVSFLTYFLMWASPGDYYSRFAEDPTKGKAWVEAERHRAGLDLGLVGGYLRWLWSTLTGDPGTSLERNQAVFPLIAGRLGATLLLSLAGLVIAWGSAIPLGVFAAVRRGRWPDRASAFGAYVFLSMPAVLFAMLMILFAYYTSWFPIGDMRDVMRWEQLGAFGRLRDLAVHLCLPAIVVGTTTMAGYMRQMRSSMLETLSQDFVRTARAKGLDGRTVVGRHALRPALNPLITLFGFSIAHLLTGSFLVEIVMNWPGMARLVVSAIFAEDLPLVMASVLVATLLLVVGNLVADILLAVADPRIRHR